MLPLTLSEPLVDEKIKNLILQVLQSVGLDRVARAHEIQLNLNLTRDGVLVVETTVVRVGQIRLVAASNVVADTLERLVSPNGRQMFNDSVSDR
jgi:hypothetical protein